jgi:hypothetical protein
MSSFTSISPDKRVRLIGTAKTPVLIDIRTDVDVAAEALEGGFEGWKAGISLYDAFYRWCATGETHNRPTNKAKP